MAINQVLKSRFCGSTNILVLHVVGPVFWSPNSTPANGSREGGTPLQFTVPRKSSRETDSPSQLSVIELAAYNSGIQCSAAHDVGDDHEPEWVKNIEMTDNVRQQKFEIFSRFNYIACYEDI